MHRGRLRPRCLVLGTVTFGRLIPAAGEGRCPGTLRFSAESPPGPPHARRQLPATSRRGRRFLKRKWDFKSLWLLCPRGAGGVLAFGGHRVPLPHKLGSPSQLGKLEASARGLVGWSPGALSSGDPGPLRPPRAGRWRASRFASEPRSPHGGGARRRDGAAVGAWMAAGPPLPHPLRRPLPSSPAPPSLLPRRRHDMLRVKRSRCAFLTFSPRSPSFPGGPLTPGRPWREKGHRRGQDQDGSWPPEKGDQVSDYSSVPTRPCPEAALPPPCSAPGPCTPHT